jgi:hypothetical protein
VDGKTHTHIYVPYLPAPHLPPLPPPTGLDPIDDDSLSVTVRLTTIAPGLLSRSTQKYLPGRLGGWARGLAGAVGMRGGPAGQSRAAHAQHGTRAPSRQATGTAHPRPGRPPEKSGACVHARLRALGPAAQSRIRWPKNGKRKTDGEVRPTRDPSPPEALELEPVAGLGRRKRGAAVRARHHLCKKGAGALGSRLTGPEVPASGVPASRVPTGRDRGWVEPTLSLRQTPKPYALLTPGGPREGFGLGRRKRGAAVRARHHLCTRRGGGSGPRAWSKGDARGAGFRGAGFKDQGRVGQTSG